MLAWFEPFANNSLMAWSAYPIVAPSGTGFALLPISVNSSPATTASGSSVPSLRFRTTATKLLIQSSNNFVYVSIDGAAPTKYDTSNTTALATQVFTVSGLSGDHVYNVWASNNVSSSRFSVASDASIIDLSSKRRLDQWGDSLTGGDQPGAGLSGDVETMSVASVLGMVGSTYGIGGETIAGLAGRMANNVTGKTASASDVCIIAIGRNDTVWDATAITNYTAIISAALAKYGRVLCRGVLPEGANLFPTVNNGISALVTSIANANVVFVNTSSWSGIATADGVHPTAAGYVTVRGYAAAAYASLV
jgi:lysophospholipase L1-like esterase